MLSESQNIEYKEHSSYPRNHNIATVFYKAGFVGSWGHRYKKTAEKFERAKILLPTIEETGGGVMAIILRKTVDEVIAERGENVGNMSETNAGNTTSTKPAERQQFILPAIKANPYVTGKALSETLSVTKRTVERDFATLQKVGVIRHEGKVNSGFWVILEKSH